MDTRRRDSFRCIDKKRIKERSLNEIVMKKRFRHAQTRDNWVFYENGEFKKRNLVTKKQKQEQQDSTVRVRN